MAMHMEQLIFPFVLIWNPLIHFSSVLTDMLCPVGNCGKVLQVIKWNDGQSASHSPRLLHDIDRNILLVSCVSLSISYSQLIQEY